MQYNAVKRTCWICGKPATVFPTMPKEIYDYSRPPQVIHKRGYRGYCEECGKAYMERREADTKEYVRLKKSLMVERAVRLLERQNVDIYDYQEAIEAVSEWVSEHPDKMESSDEVLAAIILIDNEIETKVQEKIGKYRVDFLIPSLKIVLEIDGITHADRLYYDRDRDKYIRGELGGEWEVVRIKTEYVEQNAEMLVEAIKSIRREKQKLRAEYGGELPEWFAGEKPKRPKKKRYGDEHLID